MGDLRTAFAAPTLRYVVAASGMIGRSEWSIYLQPNRSPTPTPTPTLTGSNSGDRRNELCEAQRRATLRAPFVNSSLFVETRDYARFSGSPNPNQGYHWGWNAESLFLIGNAMGEAALSLAYRPAAPPPPPSPPTKPPSPSPPPILSVGEAELLAALEELRTHVSGKLQPHTPQGCNPMHPKAATP